MTDIVERCDKIGQLENEIERLQDKCARYNKILERIAGGDGYYPELARANLVAMTKIGEGA